MLAITFREQAQAVYQTANKLIVDRTANRLEIRELTSVIEKLSKAILAEESSPDTQDALAILMRTRNVMIGNTANDRSTRLYINTICPHLAPTPTNTGYDRLQVPTVSTYHQISAPIAVYRLAPSCAQLLPQGLLKAVGPLDGRQVDLSCLTLDTRHVAGIYNNGRPLNLNTHLWTHHDILPGWDVKRNVQMGLFPVCGVYTAKGNTTHKHPRPIALGELQPMQVHSHSAYNVKRADAMLYSPDDAHFMIDTTRPFSITWTAAHDGKRTLISRLLMIHDYKDPLMQAIVGASQNSRHLDHHLEALTTNLNIALQATFQPILEALIADDSEAALKLFAALPDWHQQNIFKHVNLIKESPNSKLAFENSVTIDVKYHLGKQERIAALAAHMQEMLQLLGGEPSQLLNASAEMSSMHSEQAQILIALAQKFEDDDEGALKEFAELPAKVQDQAFNAIWRLNGHPRGDDHYGSNRFGACNNQERAHALYLAASYQPFAMPSRAIEVSDKKEKDVGSGEKLKEQKMKESSSDSLSVSDSSAPVLPLSELAAKAELVGKLGQIIEAIDVLKSFQSSGNTQQLHDLFDALGVDKTTVKYPIYDELGRLAGRPSSQRREYGRTHFTANWETLKRVIEHKIAVLMLD